VALVIAALSVPLAAHHGTNISYDRSKQFTKQATVTRFEYRNPHPQLYVEFKNDQGAVESWALELLPNPAQLINNGWSRQRSLEVMKPGTPSWSRLHRPKPAAWSACVCASPTCRARNWSPVAAVPAAGRAIRCGTPGRRPRREQLRRTQTCSIASWQLRASRS
jgi:hypothetical protein